MSELVDSLPVVAAVGAGVASLVAGLVTQRRRLRLEEARLRQEREFASMQLDVSREALEHSAPDPFVNSVAVFGRGPVTARDLDKAVRGLQRSLDKIAANLAGPATSDRVQKLELAPPLRDTNLAPDLIPDISHSLNTPLSQIEAAARAVQTELAKPTGNADAAYASGALERVVGSAEVIKAFLVSFRALSSVAATADQWRPGSLSKALESAAAMYVAASDDQEIQVSIEVGEQVPGFDNTFVLSAALPILENAIDAEHALQPAERIGVTITRRDEEGSVEISVTNAYYGEPLDGGIYEVGKTTKSGQHEGRGLHVARLLLSSRAGPRLTHSVRDGKISFTLHFPLEVGL